MGIEKCEEGGEEEDRVVYSLHIPIPLALSLSFAFIQLSSHRGRQLNLICPGNETLLLALVLGARAPADGAQHGVHAAQVPVPGGGAAGCASHGLTLGVEPRLVSARESKTR